MKNLTKFRYYLEIISVPVFAFLVIHLAGHGLMLIKDPDHDHGSHGHEVHQSHEDEDHDEHGDEHEGEENHGDEDDHEEGHDEDEALHDEHKSPLSLEFILSTEVLGGVLALMFFIWVWHTPFMKKLVPCSHDHCHHKTIWPHLLATGAFIFHFFPESAVRYELLQNIDPTSFWSLAGIIGFVSHFLVDLIIAILLASFWPKTWQKVLSFTLMLLSWILAFHVGEQGGLHLEGFAEPIILLVSAFLLTMFVHKPHKPEPVCKSCH